MANNNKSTILFDIDLILSKMDIEEKQKVAELGCGNFGFFVWPLAKTVGRYGLVYAVDILKPNLDEIKRRAVHDNLPQVKTVWSNLEIFKATNIETSSLDNALLINVLPSILVPVHQCQSQDRLLSCQGNLPNAYQCIQD